MRNRKAILLRITRVLFVEYKRFQSKELLCVRACIARRGSGVDAAPIRERETSTTHIYNILLLLQRAYRPRTTILPASSLSLRVVIYTYRAYARGNLELVYNSSHRSNYFYTYYIAATLYSSGSVISSYIPLNYNLMIYFQNYIFM